MDEALKKTLIAKAAEVRHNARAFSGFHVGAALLTKSGEIVTGCNVELHTTLSSICAERTAMGKAISEGHRDFVRIVIAGRSEDYCYPCGMCRQFMKEFAPEMQVICLNGKGEAKELTLRELLPYGFDSTFLPGEQ